VYCGGEKKSNKLSALYDFFSVVYNKYILNERLDERANRKEWIQAMITIKQ
jgi:hypothetical protein